MSSMEPSDAHYRLLVDSVRDYAVFLLDVEGVIRSWNAGAERIKGWKADEIIGKHFSVFYTPSDKIAERWKRQLHLALEQGRVEDVGWRIRKDGTQFWASVVVTPLYDASGHIGFSKVTRDLTDTMYRAFVEATNAIIWSTDGSGQPTADSPSWRAFTGQTTEEWLGRQGYDPVHPDDTDALRVTWPKAKADKTIFEAEFRLRRHDGVYVPMAARAVPFLSPDGSVREWFGVTFDISARKRAEDERERVLSRWWTTLRSIGDGLIVTDAKGLVTFMNPVAERLTGWTQEDATGKALPEVFPIVNEDTRAPGENPVERVLREGAIVGLANHTVLLRRDGTDVPIDDSAAPIFGPDRSLEGVVLVFRDASAEKRDLARRTFLARAGEALMTSFDYRESLAKVAQLAVPRLADWCAVDILEPGAVAPQRLGVAHVDHEKIAFAKQIEERYPPDPNAPAGVPNVLRTGKSELYPSIPTEMLEAGAVDAEHLRIIRELHLQSAMVVPLRGRTGVFGAITFVFAESGRHYTTEDLEFAEELARRAGLVIERRRLEEEAGIANRMKDDFLATVSHELRTPLQAILGWAEILKRGARDERKAIDIIIRNAATQARLIDDMLDVTRIISGKLSMTIRPIDLATVIRAALDAVRPAATAREVHLHEHLPANLGHIEADPDRIQQVVWNLVNNAVKFTESNGSVHVSAGREGTSVWIRVKDTGRGIPPDHLKTIFERFRQVDPSATRQHGGLGLGLAIVRYLAEAHGGTVDAASPGEGQGATFTVTLRARAAARAVPPSSPSLDPIGRGRDAGATLEGVRVLIVEDDDDTRELLVEILTSVGASVDAACSAAEAFTKIVAQPTDVLVSDIGMPGEDGYSLMQRIRALPPDKGGLVPAIAVTAFARHEDVRRAEESGFQRHVAKPADPATLISAVRSLAVSGASRSA